MNERTPAKLTDLIFTLRPVDYPNVVVTKETFDKIKKLITGVLTRSNLDISSMETFMPKYGVIMIETTNRQLATLTQSIVATTDWEAKNLPRMCRE